MILFGANSSKGEIDTATVIRYTTREVECVIGWYNKVVCYVDERVAEDIGEIVAFNVIR